MPGRSESSSSSWHPVVYSVAVAVAVAVGVAVGLGVGVAVVGEEVLIRELLLLLLSVAIMVREPIAAP